MSHIRLLYIDRLKGFAIYLVVLGHILQHYFSDSALIVRVIYSFHIPLFMFMSGFVCYRKTEWSFITQKAWQLLIPFFSYILLRWCFDYITSVSTISLSQYFTSVLLHPDHGLWFLWALFFISVIFIVSRKISNTIKVPEICIHIAIAVILNTIVMFLHFRLFGFHWIAWYYVYFIAGVLWRYKVNNINTSCSLPRKIFITTVIAFPVTAYFFRMHNEAPTFYEYINLGAYFPIFYRLLVGFLGIGLCLSYFQIISNNNAIYRKLKYWGAVSLGIYYLHFFLLEILYRMIISNNTIETAIITFFASIIISWQSATYSNKINTNHIFALLINGKRL